jgi:phosphatidylinositol glycan class N
LPVALSCAAAANVWLNLKAISWSVLILSFASYFIFFREEKKRLILHVAPIIVLLSINYESIFLFVLFLCLESWRKNNNDDREKKMANVSSAVIFLLFSYASFFGAGNEGSLSSFEISSSYRFATVFSPFLIFALLAAKNLLPIIIVGETFAKIAKREKNGKSLVKVVGMSNVLAFSFFFLIRTEGSWRDIGLSISHFLIANVQTLLALFFCLLWK